MEIVSSFCSMVTIGEISTKDFCQNGVGITRCCIVNFSELFKCFICLLDEFVIVILYRLLSTDSTPVIGRRILEP